MGESDKHLMPTYKRLPVAFARGEGAWLWDTAGKQYLDAISGIAVAGLGHAHPELTKALAEQAGRLIHTSNLFEIPLQEELAARLCRLAGMDRAFFCNSGAEANEAALKLARRFGHEKGVEVPTVIVMEGAFHGRTLATLSATGNRKVQAGFEPLVSGFRRVPFNDLDAVEQVAEHASDVVAVLVEPIQGESGVIIPARGYLKGLREICDRRGWLLMLDEIQTGMCRTGRWFAFQHEEVQPDVLTLAKGLGNGIPVGACLARGAAAGILVPGSHGSTFGGNPFACRAALTVVDILEREDYARQAADVGAYLFSELVRVVGPCPDVRAVRGVGLMIGVELNRPGETLARIALERGLIINVTAERVVRLLPPLLLTRTQASLLVARLALALREFGEEKK
jgi:acetylornithine aminotransferase